MRKTATIEKNMAVKSDFMRRSRSEAIPEPIKLIMYMVMCATQRSGDNGFGDGSNHSMATG